jgi:hypothetical protein
MQTTRLLSSPLPRRLQEGDEDGMDGAMELNLSDHRAAPQNPSDVSFLSMVDKWSWASFIAPSDNMLQKSTGFSSLDYDTIYNDGEEHYLDKRKLGRSVWGFTGTTLIRWFIFVFIGIITGSLGRFMELSIDQMHTWRNSAFDRCDEARYRPSRSPKSLEQHALLPRKRRLLLQAAVLEPDARRKRLLPGRCGRTRRCRLGH